MLRATEKYSLTSFANYLMGNSKRLRISMIVSVVVFTVLMLSAYSWNNSQEINAITFAGHSICTSPELESYLDSGLVGSLRQDITLLDVQQMVCQAPFVRQAHAKFSNNNTIEISITEREPVAVLLDNWGRIKYSDKYGEIMPYRIDPRIADMPVFRNFFFAGRVDMKVLASGLKLLKAANKNKVVYNLISEVIYDRKSHGFEMILADRGTKVIIGSTDEIEEKFDMLGCYWQYYAPRTKKCCRKYLDMRWSGQLVIN